MNIRQLEAFSAIVQLGSFVAAAVHLNATQSTISARIQELEATLGVDLFDRSQRRAQLTAKGRELLPLAERAIAAFADIRHKIGAPDAISGVVRLGVSELIALAWLPKLAAIIRERYPNLQLELDVSLTYGLLHRLRSGEIDVALIPGVGSEPDLQSRSLGRVHFAWMASGSAEVPDRVLEPGDLCSWRILSLGPNSVHNRTVAAWLSLQREQRQPVDICNSMAVVASLTAAGYGISLLPVSLYEPEIRSGALQVLKTEPDGSDVEFFAVYAPRQPATIPQIVAELASEASTFLWQRS